MTFRTLMMISAVAALAMLGIHGPASACCKSQWERTKVHDNVGALGHVKPNRTAGPNIGMGGIKRQTTPSAQQTELLIFVTPRIVRPTN